MCVYKIYLIIFKIVASHSYMFEVAELAALKHQTFELHFPFRHCEIWIVNEIMCEDS